MKVASEDVKLLQTGQVDSRLKNLEGQGQGFKGEILGGAGEVWEPVFCVFCNKRDGFVTRETSKQAKIYNAVRICDSCHAAMSLPDTFEKMEEDWKQERDEIYKTKGIIPK